MNRRTTRTFLVAVLTGGWLLAVAAGLRGLVAYANRPGEAAAVISDWPTGTSLVRDPRRANLVMFVHPMCPCTAASGEELARLMVRCGDRLRAQVVVVQPKGAPDNWGESKLIADLRRLPGVSVTLDRGGAESHRFGAKTSGQVNLYDVTGRLRFSGGITESRGHAGDNAGSDAILALVTGDAKPGGGVIAVATINRPVYGCSLLGQESSATESAPGINKSTGVTK